VSMVRNSGRRARRAIALRPKNVFHLLLRLIKYEVLLWCLLPGALFAQISPPLQKAQLDSLIESLIDTTKPASADSLPRFAPRKNFADAVAAPKFFSPNIGLRMDTVATATHLYQDFLHLAAQTVPLIPLLAGEVGQPRYWAAGDLPPRAVQIVLDDIHWIPGVYGTVDLTGLPDAHVQILETAGENFSASSYTIHLASDSLNFAAPFSRIEYMKGPFGADAVRFRFGRALGKRLAAYLNSAFSNSDGQFEDRPYEGHKANLQLEYFLNTNWQLRYRHLNSRNETGLGVPFFPEEWPGITDASHKDERLYHALELSSRHDLQWRSFIWQVKEELNDPARRYQHRRRDAGTDLRWRKETEKWALRLKFGLGYETIKSTSIDERNRFYEQISSTFNRRLTQRTWLQLGGHLTYKTNWPADAALQAQLIAQKNLAWTWWLSESVWKIAPAVGERDNDLPYLKRNDDLRAAILHHSETGLKWQRQNFTLQIRLHGSLWKSGFIFQADTSKNSGTLLNNNESKFVVATQLALNWRLAQRWQLGATSTQTLNGLPQDFWFWHQPEGYNRVYLETQQSLFGNDLELLPRLAGRLVGKRYSPSLATTAVQLLDDDLPAAAVLDFQIRLQHGDGAFLFSWENILNKRFDWRHGVPAVGRYLRWGFWWNFWD